MIRAVFIIVLLLAGTATAASSVTVKVPSKSGLFTAIVTRPQPVPVEALHTWRVRLLDRQRRPIVRAGVEVTGDMPEHGHGLPTQPVAVARGRGLYALQGMMFQMPGRWYVQLKVRAAGRVDTVRIRFTIAD